MNVDYITKRYHWYINSYDKYGLPCVVPTDMLTLFKWWCGKLSTVERAFMQLDVTYYAEALF